jgi:hypothetical protein
MRRLLAYRDAQQTLKYTHFDGKKVVLIVEVVAWGNLVMCRIGMLGEYAGNLHKIFSFIV